MPGDPAYAKPIPAIEYLNAAARLAGFRDWFDVPTFLQSPENRRVIVNARILALDGRPPLRPMTEEDEDTISEWCTGSNSVPPSWKAEEKRP